MTSATTRKRIERAVRASMVDNSRLEVPSERYCARFWIGIDCCMVIQVLLRDKSVEVRSDVSCGA